MEYVEGYPVSRFCSKDTLLPVRKALEVVISVCEAVDYAHRNGVIHRDIKPENIMVNEEGIAKITDFGVAQLTERTMPFGIFGTPSYMSPEQLKDEFVEKTGDIFSLGCVLYELLSGEQAFYAENLYSVIYKVINEDPESILAIRPQLPEILARITEKALSKDPKERYQSCIDFAGDLRVALRGLTGVGKTEKIEDLVDFIHGLPFFQDFTKSQAKAVLAATKTIKVPKGKRIATGGEISDTFYIILRGKVGIRKGKRALALIQSGECFGEMACISGRPRVADAVAETDCILMKVKAEILDGSSDSIQLSFYKTFAKTLVRRLSRTSEKIDSQSVMHKKTAEHAA